MHNKKNHKTYKTETQSVELRPLKVKGFILDIGGGGEGIIGKLNQRQVIAIDTNERELKETPPNDSLKIVMDATDLKFLPKSFDACTAFFSLMYMPKEKHLKVFTEVNRVLKDKSEFLLWDVKMPENQGSYDLFAVRLKVLLPNEEVETGYGTLWNKTQNLEYFKDLARKTKFRVLNEWSKGKIFHLEMQKEA